MEYTNEEILSELFRRIDERFKVLESRIEKPKKLVTKVVDCDGYIVSRLKSTNDIPKDAKNVRCTYEIEE